MDVLFPPIIDSNREALLLDGLLPLVPKIYGPAIRLVLRLIDPDSAWQQTRITDNQCLACIKGRKDIAKASQTIRQQAFYNALVLRVSQPHGYEVTALAEHRLIHL